MKPPLKAPYINISRPGLNKLVGSPFRIKQIQDGKEKMSCKGCQSQIFPDFSMDGDIYCPRCGYCLYG